MTETAASHPAGARKYSLIFLVLIAVTLFSLLTAEILIARNSPASSARTAIILLVSMVKALLIILFYMHLKYESRPVQIVATVPVLFMAILMVILTAFPNPVVAVAATGGHGGPGAEVPPVPGGAAAPHAPGEKPASGGTSVAAGETNRTPSVSEASPLRGEAIFKGKGLSIACSACHSAGSDRIVGPGLKGAGALGADFIRESIVNPSAKIAAGFPDAMPKTFAKDLCGKETKSPADVAGCKNLEDLVAYLESLK